MQILFPGFSVLRPPIEQLAAHDHFESAVWQLRKADAGLLEHFIDSKLCEMPGFDGCFFQPIYCALSYLRFSAQFGLTPAQHRSRSSHPYSKKSRIGVPTPRGRGS